MQVIYYSALKCFANLLLSVKRDKPK